MRTLLASLAALACLATASADECSWSTSNPEIAFAGFYVDNDLCQVDFSCVFSIWWYHESNDLPGLQRDDEVQDDTCDGQIEGDTLVT